MLDLCRLKSLRICNNISCKRARVSRNAAVSEWERSKGGSTKAHHFRSTDNLCIRPIIAKFLLATPPSEPSRCW
eukprot:scaffold1540_cov194-Alexandrium_tamarense.AAC.21